MLRFLIRRITLRRLKHVMSEKYRELYSEKEKCYFSNIRHDIIDLITCHDCNILELGCGSGATLIELKKQGKARLIAGIDIVELGQAQKLDHFVSADIENEDLDLPHDFFDVIICADVLEHLKHPLNVVEKLTFFLKKGGVVIASIPNVREINTIISIVLKGDFKYVDSGILDKTHLRFFCKKNMLELFEQADLKVERLQNASNSKPSLLRLLTFGLFEDFLIAQYIIIGRKI